MISILVGTILGFLSGLGVGGGSLLILWITLIEGVNPSTARSVNLLFFLPCALIAAVCRWKQGSLPLKKLLPAILSGCAAALFFSVLARKMNVSFLKKLFGGLLIVTGIRELFLNPKKNREGH